MTVVDPEGLQCQYQGAEQGVVPARLHGQKGGQQQQGQHRQRGVDRQGPGGTSQAAGKTRRGRHQSEKFEVKGPAAGIRDNPGEALSPALAGAAEGPSPFGIKGFVKDGVGRMKGARSLQGQTPGDKVVLCPVCFVFKPRTVSASLLRLFPCDTGAVSGNVFKPAISAGDLSELELDPMITSARKAVSLFFDTNSDYFILQARRRGQHHTVRQDRHCKPLDVIRNRETTPFAESQSLSSPVQALRRTS